MYACRSQLFAVHLAQNYPAPPLPDLRLQHCGRELVVTYSVDYVLFGFHVQDTKRRMSLQSSGPDTSCHSCLVEVFAGDICMHVLCPQNPQHHKQRPRSYPQIRAESFRMVGGLSSRGFWVLPHVNQPALLMVASTRVHSKPFKHQTGCEPCIR